MISITSHDDLATGLAALKLLDPQIAQAIGDVDSVPLRNRAPGFEGLAEIIVAQQVSKASATAIFGRLRSAVSPFEPHVFLNRGERVWVDAGLSRSKQVALAALAKCLLEDGTFLTRLCDLPPGEALEQLVALKGVGPWTAEVFLLFCAGHADIFPAGDVALQHAVGWVCRCPKKPDAAQTRMLAERWAPWRGVAARVLYALYATRKGMPVAPL